MSYKVFLKNIYGLSHCWAFTHAIVFIQILEGIFPFPSEFNLLNTYQSFKVVSSIKLFLLTLIGSDLTFNSYNIWCVLFS